jgi:hypothetical protein
MSGQDKAGSAKEGGKRQCQQPSRDHGAARAVLRRDH